MVCFFAIMSNCMCYDVRYMILVSIIYVYICTWHAVYVYHDIILNHYLIMISFIRSWMLIAGKTAILQKRWPMIPMITSFWPSFSVSLPQPQLLRVSHHEVHQHRPAHRGAGFQRQYTFAVASNHRLKPLNRYTMRHVKRIPIAAGAGKTFSTLVLWFVQVLETSSDWSVSTFPFTFPLQRLFDLWYLIDSKFPSTTSLIPTNNRSGPGSVFDSVDVASPERLPALLGSSAPLAVALPAIKKNWCPHASSQRSKIVAKSKHLKITSAKYIQIKVDLALT